MGDFHVISIMHVNMYLVVCLIKNVPIENNDVFVFKKKYK